jgi:FMN phosphatase YigB (HAD superfamily)
MEIFMKDKVILTDVDGVLLDWGHSFHMWMTRHGYTKKKDGIYCIREMYGIDKAEGDKLTRMFNESATIRKLSPLRDAMKYVKKLHEEHGYVFHAITSLSDDEYAQHLRTKNLRETFGSTVFEKYVYLDTGADKDEVLEQYRGTDCYWVEDKIENALVGQSVGLDSLLMEHEHNGDFDHDEVRIVRNWRDIYDIIVGF